MNELEPEISKETIEYHYGKHHKTYVDKLNKLIKKTEFENLPLLDIVQNSSGDIFNAAAQHWNHSFYWECLNQPGPSINILLHVEKALEDNFGSQINFWNEFKEQTLGLFGSGWVWLVCAKNRKLKIETTSNADTPAKNPDKKCLLVCDVWEHAYYIDYRNDREKYFDAWKACVDRFGLNHRYQETVAKF